MNKDMAIAYLKEINKGSEVTTRLRYNDSGDYVQDFTHFANSNYMSESLLNALQNGQTLTSVLEKELQQFVIEKAI